MRAAGRHKLGNGLCNGLGVHSVLTPQIFLRTNDGREAGLESNTTESGRFYAGIHARLGNKASKSAVNGVLFDGDNSACLTTRA